MSDNVHGILSPKDEALLILEYLENEHMTNTFLHFLDESKHLINLRSHLYANYENSNQQQQQSESNDDNETSDFQTFFNKSLTLSKQILPTNNFETESSIELNPVLTSTFDTSNNFVFDEDFLDIGLADLISQTPPPMDYYHDLPDTPVPSVPPLLNDNEDFTSAMSSIEQLFAMQHAPLATPPHHQIVQVISDGSSNNNNNNSRLTSSTVPFAKCIVVTQDFLQSMYTQQQQQHPPSMMTNTTSSSMNNNVRKAQRRPRRLKVGKENYHQQRKLMPRTTATSPEH